MFSVGYKRGLGDTYEECIGGRIIVLVVLSRELLFLAVLGVLSRRHVFVGWGGEGGELKKDTCSFSVEKRTYNIMIVQRKHFSFLFKTWIVVFFFYLFLCVFCSGKRRVL